MLNHSADGETTEDEEYPEGPIKPPATNAVGCCSSMCRTPVYYVRL